MSQRLQSLGQGFAMAMRQAPGGFTRLFLLNVVAGAAPAAVLYIQNPGVPLCGSVPEGVEFVRRRHRDADRLQHVHDAGRAVVVA